MQTHTIPNYPAARQVLANLADATARVEHRARLSGRASTARRALERRLAYQTALGLLAGLPGGAA